MLAARARAIARQRLDEWSIRRLSRAHRRRLRQTNVVRIGRVGLGGWGRRLDIALLRSPDAVIHSCLDLDARRASTYADQTGCRSVPDYEAMLGDPGLDAVVLATPNLLHAEEVIAAAAAGKAVFVEKPLATRLEDARNAVRACEDAGVVLSVGHNTRRRGAFRRMRELVESNDLGTVVLAEASISNPQGLELGPTNWRFSEEECPTGPLLQIGIHLVDTLLYLLGPVRSVHSIQRRIRPEARIPETTSTLLEFETSVPGSLCSSYLTPTHTRLMLAGTGGNAICTDFDHLALQRAGARRPGPVRVQPVDTVLEEIREFVACIRNGDRPETDGEAALQTLSVIEAARRSAASGRPEPVPA